MHLAVEWFGARSFGVPQDDSCRIWRGGSPVAPKCRHFSGPLEHDIMSTKPTYEIDGSRLTTLEEFFEQVSTVLIPGADWGRNLDAFNDVLRGGFGTPEGGFVLRWTNSRLSRQRLGYSETVRQLERRLQRCHPSNRPHVARDLEAARRGEGPTVFDWLVEIISVHSIGGTEAEDGVELVLA